MEVAENSTVANTLAELLEVEVEVVEVHGTVVVEYWMKRWL